MNMNKLMRVDQPQTEAGVGCEIDRSIKSNLTRQRDQLEERLMKVNAAIEALNAQPNVAELLETVMKVL